MRSLAVCVGDNCVDHYLPPVNTNYSGGNAVNVAVHLQRSGCQAAYLGAVGDDPDGAQILSDLRREGVDTSRVKVLPTHTACTHIQLTPAGDRQFVYEDLGPKDLFKLDENDLAFIQQHRLAHFTWQGGTEDDLPRIRAAAPGLLLSQDYGERCGPSFIDQTIAHIDIAFFSVPEEDEADILALARQILARGPRLVVITIGRLGSLAYDGVPHRQAAASIRAVDTLGAGDAYIGVFLAGWLDGRSIPACMQTAAQVAAQTCTHYGGW